MCLREHIFLNNAICDHFLFSQATTLLLIANQVWSVTSVITMADALPMDLVVHGDKRMFQIQGVILSLACNVDLFSIRFNNVKQRIGHYFTHAGLTDELMTRKLAVAWNICEVCGDLNTSQLVTKPVITYL